MRMSTLHKGKKSNRPAPLSLPIDLWPTADRSAWESACLTSDRLKRGGAASHLKSVTRNDLAYWYGYFLGFLSRNGLLTEDKSAPEYVSPENVDDYLMEIKHRVGSVSVHNAIYKLRRASQLIAPNRDFAWLAEIGKDLALTMRPRSKSGRLVLTEVLVEAGLSLIAEAETSTSMTGFRRAREICNGLMIALLALCPIRLKNFVALEIGRTFVDVNDKWWIVLPATETKEGRADERPIDNILNPAIESYIATFRPILEARGSPRRLSGSREMTECR